MFKFPLEQLRKYRKRIEEKYQKELFDCDRELVKAQETLNDLNQSKLRVKEKSRQYKETSFRPSENALYDYYFNCLNQKILEQHKSVDKKIEKKSHASNRLLEAVIKRKMIEKLKEYRLAEHQIREQKTEQFNSDESAILRFKKNKDFFSK